MSDIFQVSPLRLPVKDQDGNSHPLYRIEIQDLSRGLCGALFLALPLHFTMEMWDRARAIPALMLIVIILVAYLLNVGFAYFSNYKNKVSRQVPWLDALTCMGIGFFASTITLVLIDQLSHQMSTEVLINCIALEMVPTSFGAALAKSQLGVGSTNKVPDLTKNWSRDKIKITAATLGAFMFSFNVAATQEPILITTSIKPWQLIGIIVFSIAISYLMVFLTGYETKERDHKGIMGKKWAETIVCYAISIVVSALLLVMFGYLDFQTPLSLALPWIIVLSYATSLGGSAGRLVI